MTNIFNDYVHPFFILFVQLHSLKSDLIPAAASSFCRRIREHNIAASETDPNCAQELAKPRPIPLQLLHCIRPYYPQSSGPVSAQLYTGLKCRRLNSTYPLRRRNPGSEPFAAPPHLSIADKTSDTPTPSKPNHSKHFLFTARR